MKSLNKINEINNTFTEKYKLDPAQAIQKSEAWHTVKLGVVSASNASKVVAKKGTQTRATYMAELVAQVCAGPGFELTGPALDWGVMHEDAARSYYEFMTQNKVLEVPFIFKDEKFRVGCSPDGIIEDKKGIEIKCPFSTKNYIEFYTDDKIKPEYFWQYQFTLWCLDAEEWDFVQYDPRMKKNPMKILPVYKDDKAFQQLDECVPEFIEDMDKMLNTLGFRFGEQWEGFIT